MRHVIVCLSALLLAAPASSSQDASGGSVDPALAERFAGLALSCVHREYPNKIVMSGDAEADLMRRVLKPDEFAGWLDGFLPSLPKDGAGDWLEPGIVLDPTDPKLAHLDGLNLSRAWMLEGMVAGLPESDARIAGLRAAAGVHREAGLRSVTDEHYEGGHWLGSFAVYLVTGRGLPNP